MAETDMIKRPSVLMTGGSGLVGRHLTSLLLSEGYRVSHLSVRTNQFGTVRVFRWDPGKGIIDPEVFAGIDYIVHLAGASIGEKVWSKKRKDEIISSRAGAAKLLHKTIIDNQIPLRAFISASAAGYYGSATSEKIFTEEDTPAPDFTGTTCRLWEEAADLFEKSGMRSVKIRSGVVLGKDDSALSKLMAPARYGLLVRTGSGKQYFPWIHIADLCNIYLKAINDEKMAGAYNAVAPQHITHGEFMKTLSKTLNRPLLLLPLPGLFIRLALGSMSDIILKGSRISAEKIKNTGYSFLFGNVEAALKEIIKN